MFAFKRCLRLGFQALSGALGLLIVGLAMAVPVAAQGPEPTLSAIANGQQQPVQADQTEELAENQKALKANPKSSLANYRSAEVLFSHRNYQASANACRSALRGDGDPSWTRVWSHIQLGKIFDVTDQRDRAVREYQLAVETNDNTRGAVDEARELLQTPYRFPETH